MIPLSYPTVVDTIISLYVVPQAPRGMVYQRAFFTFGMISRHGGTYGDDVVVRRTLKKKKDKKTKEIIIKTGMRHARMHEWWRQTVVRRTFQNIKIKNQQKKTGMHA